MTDNFEEFAAAAKKTTAAPSLVFGEAPQAPDPSFQKPEQPKQEILDDSMLS